MCKKQTVNWTICGHTQQRVHECKNGPFDVCKFTEKITYTLPNKCSDCSDSGDSETEVAERESATTKARTRQRARRRVRVGKHGRETREGTGRTTHIVIEDDCIIS